MDAASLSAVQIHPLAVVAPGAQLGAGVEIGPFCTVGPHVVIQDGAKLVSHVVVDLSLIHISEPTRPY